MDELEAQVCKQVRLYRHLYDPSMRGDTDSQTSWREIGESLGKDGTVCWRLWKNLRDRFVKAKKRAQQPRRGGASRGHKPAPILTEMGWLCEFVKHRKTAKKIKEEDISTEADYSCAESPSEVTISSITKSSGTPPPTPPVPSSPSPTPSPSLSTSCASPPPRSPKRKRKREWIADESLVTKRLERLNEERTEFMRQYREDRERERERKLLRDTQQARFARVIEDMLCAVDPAYQQEAMHKLYQVMFDYTANHPRLPS